MTFASRPAQSPSWAYVHLCTGSEMHGRSPHPTLHRAVQQFGGGIQSIGKSHVQAMEIQVWLLVDGG